MSFEGKFEEKNATGEDVDDKSAASTFEGKNAEVESVNAASAAASSDSAKGSKNSMESEGFWLKNFIRESGVKIPEEHRLVIVGVCSPVTKNSRCSSPA